MYAVFLKIYVENYSLNYQLLYDYNNIVPVKENIKKMKERFCPDDFNGKMSEQKWWLKWIANVCIRIQVSDVLYRLASIIWAQKITAHSIQ